MKPSASILEGLKKTSTVSESIDKETGEIRDPSQGSGIGKVRGQVNTAKIRDLIASINAEKD
mgnify:CR=1 FL=1